MTSWRASHRFDGSAELVRVCVVVLVVVPVVVLTSELNMVLVAGVTLTCTNDLQSSSLSDDAASCTARRQLSVVHIAAASVANAITAKISRRRIS